jgi:hypothetical protein
MSHVANRPLTWQQILAVVLGSIVAFMLILTVLAFAGLAFWRYRHVFPVVAAVLAAPVPLFVAWHYVVHHRADTEPDLLARLCDPEQVLHAGDAHLCVTGGVEGEALVVVVLVQNLFAAENEVRVTLGPEAGGHLLRSPLLPLRIDVGPAGVVAAQVRIPLRTPAGPEQVKLGISAWSRAGPAETGPARKVRFARRTALALPTDADVLIGALGRDVRRGLAVARAVMARHATFQVEPRPRTAGRGKPCETWRVEALWSPGESLEVAARRLAALAAS